MKSSGDLIKKNRACVSLFSSFTHRRVWQEMTGSCDKR